MPEAERPELVSFSNCGECLRRRETSEELVVSAIYFVGSLRLWSSLHIFVGLPAWLCGKDMRGEVLP